MAATPKRRDAMFNKIGKFGATVAALAAVAVGASAVAGAATGGAGSGSGQPSAAPQGYGAPPGAPPAGYGAPQGAPRAGMPQHKPETPLTGDTAAKVKAAASAKVPGGTIERVETDSDHGSPYEAHVRKSDGTELEVLVNKQLEVTAVNTMRPPDAHPGARPGGPGAAAGPLPRRQRSDWRVRTFMPFGRMADTGRDPLPEV